MALPTSVMAPPTAATAEPIVSLSRNELTTAAKPSKASMRSSTNGR